MDTGKGSIADTGHRRTTLTPLRLATSHGGPPVRGVASPPCAPMVLLAEHNRISQRLLRRVLLGLGYQVHIANSVGEALQVYERNPEIFNLVVLDLKAPLDGGVDFLHRWPVTVRGTCAPVIALGNDPSERARRDCLAAGASAYLVEALRDDRLRRTVKALEAKAREQAGKARGTSPVQDPSNPPPVLDERAFRALLDMSPDPTFIRELVADFRDDAKVYFSRMQAALSRRDAHDWHEAIHALKGSAMSVGAMPLAKLCAQHENLSLEALRAGRGFSEYALILEVFHRSVDAMQEMMLGQAPGNSAQGPAALQAGA
jgi:CheY-like chemotaxis protein/HPt (histidine-containing phosphotransfer) domain-containing protein